MVLHDAIKTIQNGVCVFFKEQRLVSFIKKLKTQIKENTRMGFKKKRVFLNPDYLSILFCDFPLIAQSGKSQVTISLIGCVPKIPGNEEAENYWHLNT